MKLPDAEVTKVRTEKEIKDKITELERAYSHVLKGSIATVEVNARVRLVPLSPKPSRPGRKRK